jgi:hypothetical protein
MALHSGGRQNRSCHCIAIILILLTGVLWHVPAVSNAADNLPERLSDQEFWRLTEEFSEPGGYFRSDNLLSNESWMQQVIAELLGWTQRGGAYLGVGPEQNFTYIAALKPRIVFITDIRRGNLHTQLMYKALFELAGDRADFVSRLFTRKRPDGLGSNSTVQEIFQKLDAVTTGDETAYQENLRAIRGLLVEKHKLPLSKEDLAGIEYVVHSFYRFGPGIHYNSSGQSSGGRGGSFVTYADLMTLTDEYGLSRGYLASEENFKTVKDLEEKNLIIPIVGNFSGPKALRAIGKYLKEHNSTVTAFYLSNVEQYLDRAWGAFCANVATLPLDEKSTFIRTSRGRPGIAGTGGGMMPTLGSMQNETRDCSGVR